MTRTRQGGGLNIENMTIVANDPREAARVTADEWTWLAKTGGF